MTTSTNGATAANSMKRPFKYGNIDITKVECDNRALRIYLDGVFDMTHFGHFRLFKNIKAKFPNAIVVVGVSGDEETIRLKGQTVMNEVERKESISFCRYVDEVICPCPWIITQSFIDANKIDYVAHDVAPYISNGQDIYDFVKKQGRFLATQRTDGISTTGLINRIICRYNEYVLRNLKRGISRKELNVSWTRQKRIEMKDKLVIITDNVTKWMDEPNSFVDDFLKVFGADGQILKKIQKQREKIIEVFGADGKILKKFQKQREKIIEDNPSLSKFLTVNVLFICVVVVIIATGIILFRTI